MPRGAEGGHGARDVRGGPLLPDSGGCDAPHPLLWIALLDKRSVEDELPRVVFDSRVEPPLIERREELMHLEVVVDADVLADLRAHDLAPLARE